MPSDDETPTMREIIDIADPSKPTPQGRIVRQRRWFRDGFKNDGAEIGSDTPDQSSNDDAEGDTEGDKKP